MGVCELLLCDDSAKLGELRASCVVDRSQAKAPAPNEKCRCVRNRLPATESRSSERAVGCPVFVVKCEGNRTHQVEAVPSNSTCSSAARRLYRCRVGLQGQFAALPLLSRCYFAAC